MVKITSSLPKSWECPFRGPDFSRMPLLCLPPGKTISQPAVSSHPDAFIKAEPRLGWLPGRFHPAAPLPSPSVPSPYLGEAARVSWQPGERGREKAHRHTGRNRTSVFEGRQAVFVHSLASMSLHTSVPSPANTTLANCKLKSSLLTRS